MGSHRSGAADDKAQVAKRTAKKTYLVTSARGVTEIVFQPCGPDIRAELERFLDAARG
jgi:hypothetical protein